MFAPVTFEENKRGRFRTITTVPAAARVLTEWWPEARGPGYSAALQACLAYLDGTGSEEAAQEAFLAALRGAEVFVRE